MSQVIGRVYNPYAMSAESADIAGGLLKGMEIAKQKGVAAGMEKIANGDESGWADVARYSPDLYMRQQQLKSLQDDKAWDRQYKQEMLGLERQRLNKENKTQAQRDFEYYQSLTPEQQALYNKLNEKAWTTDLGRAWGILNDPNSTPEQKELAKGIVAYAGRIPEVNQNWSYGGRRGTLEADRELGGKVEEEKKLGQARGEYAGKEWEDQQKGWGNYNGEKKALKGSIAEREWLASNNKTITNNDMAIRAGKTVLADIDALEKMYEKDPNSVSGFSASMVNFIPGTVAADAKARADSIRGNIAVDNLLNIKQSGAGLGQVPQSQAEMLSGLFGSLAQTQSDKEFMSTLRRIKGIYSDVINAAQSENKGVYDKIYDPEEQNGKTKQNDPLGIL